jgi:O-antigen/teichoic acid export membrane protein
MEKEKSAYRQIMKATSIFGGVQVFKILIEIVRSKIIAVLLGTTGMGVAGLLISTTAMISAFTNLGLGTSAVRDIAEAHETKEPSRVSLVITIFRKLVWFTGILGALVTLLLSSIFSEITFGNNEYTVAFMWLSLTLLFNQLTSGQIVLLQGMRKLKYLAKANMFGSLLGLLVSIPLYFYYKIDGIVPAILASSIFSLIIARYFAKKIEIEPIKTTKKEFLLESKGMVQLGIMLSLSALITIGFSYIIRIFINKYGDLDQVGLYTAGFTIVSGYAGLVFSAMSTDYYPRLASASKSNEKSKKIINQQAEIGILVLAPFLALFLIFINYLIIILYSSSFVAITGMVHWATLGIYFKVACWSVGFILLAKGASKLFLMNEVIMNIYMFVFNVLGYYFYGLDGLGVAFFISNILYTVQIYFMAKKNYQFKFSKELYKIFSIHFTIGLLCFLCIKFLPLIWVYVIGVPLVLTSFLYSYKELEKRIGIKEIFSKFRKN